MFSMILSSEHRSRVLYLLEEQRTLLQKVVANQNAAAATAAAAAATSTAVAADVPEEMFLKHPVFTKYELMELDDKLSSVDQFDAFVSVKVFLGFLSFYSYHNEQNLLGCMRAVFPTDVFFPISGDFNGLDST